MLFRVGYYIVVGGVGGGGGDGDACRGGSGRCLVVVDVYRFVGTIRSLPYSYTATHHYCEEYCVTGGAGEC